MEHKIITTSDGSHSIYIPELNENYHSIHGAIQESKHVFIDAGLKLLGKREKINILEVGFGTGLNALLTLIENINSELRISYTAIESFPLNEKFFLKLNYVSLLNQFNDLQKKDLSDIFNRMHQSEWDKDVLISELFKLKKVNNTFQETILKNNVFDLIYFDAFGPPVQPEMWTDQIFSKVAASAKPGAILVTYCAKGEVKRILKRTGFIVESLPGPPGKREMIRAIKV
jgi:tRNA U34 5-methylaminomethyl-2-thiouridine-forming methyltransferase MnmC